MGAPVFTTYRKFLFIWFWKMQHLGREARGFAFSKAAAQKAAFNKAVELYRKYDWP